MYVGILQDVRQNVWRRTSKFWGTYVTKSCDVRHEKLRRTSRNVVTYVMEKFDVRHEKLRRTSAKKKALLFFLSLGIHCKLCG
jgi:hypothetical protein